MPEARPTGKLRVRAACNGSGSCPERRATGVAPSGRCRPLPGERASARVE
ncbi:hypothetical protein D516_1246 [Rhodobacter sp. AKP1]|nr:hypothetical protein D516_1246 [Rhodobacter sp. AKP1]